MFLLFVLGENRASRWNVVPRRFDKAILLLVLAGIFVALLVETLRMIAAMRVLPALLLGAMCAALFNVIRELLRAKDVA